jgi:hypothetical protein
MSSSAPPHPPELQRSSRPAPPDSSLWPNSEPFPVSVGFANRRVKRSSFALDTSRPGAGLGELGDRADERNRPTKRRVDRDLDWLIGGDEAEDRLVVEADGEVNNTRRLLPDDRASRCLARLC